MVVPTIGRFRKTGSAPSPRSFGGGAALEIRSWTVVSPAVGSGVVASSYRQTKMKYFVSEESCVVIAACLNPGPHESSSHPSLEPELGSSANGPAQPPLAEV